MILGASGILGVLGLGVQSFRVWGFGGREATHDKPPTQEKL